MLSQPINGGEKYQPTKRHTEQFCPPVILYFGLSAGNPLEGLVKFICR